MLIFAVKGFNNIPQYLSACEVELRAAGGGRGRSDRNYTVNGASSS